MIKILIITVATFVYNLAWAASQDITSRIEQKFAEIDQKIAAKKAKRVAAKQPKRKITTISFTNYMNSNMAEQPITVSEQNAFQPKKIKPDLVESATGVPEVVRGPASVDQGTEDQTPKAIEP